MSKEAESSRQMRRRQALLVFAVIAVVGAAIGSSAWIFQLQSRRNEAIAYFARRSAFPVHRGYDFRFADVRNLNLRELHAGFVLFFRNSRSSRHVCIGPGIDAEVFEHLQALRYVDYLSFRNAAITDSDLDQLEPLSPFLKTLDVSMTPLTDRAAVHLTRLKYLTELDLSNTLVTDESLVQLEKLTNLRKLDLANTLVHKPPMRRLGQLTHLDLTNTTITDSALEHIGAMPALTSLNLMNTRITDEGLKHLMQLRNLESLDLCMTSITGAGLEHLAALRKLTALDLSYTPITDAGMAHLLNLRNLERLNLTFTRLSDEGLVHLGRLNRLDVVITDNTNVTEIGARLLPCSYHRPAGRK